MCLFSQLKLRMTISTKYDFFTFPFHNNKQYQNLANNLDRNNFVIYTKGKALYYRLVTLTQFPKSPTLVLLCRASFKLQTYHHHPEYRSRSWSTQMPSPSHLHTQARVQSNKYIQPYLYKVFVWTKQNNLTLNPGKTTCTLFTPDPAEYKSNLDLKTHYTTHGNAPKGSGHYLRPNNHIQHTHPQHLSTSTQTSTNHKSTHCNRMG